MTEDELKWHCPVCHDDDCEICDICGGPTCTCNDNLYGHYRLKKEAELARDWAEFENQVNRTYTGRMILKAATLIAKVFRRKRLQIDESLMQDEEDDY